jgi:hypothetical protein
LTPATAASNAPRRRYVPITASRALASTLGTLPAGVLAAAAIARFAPVPRPLAFGLAYALWVPLWITAACWVGCARGAGRAWLRVAIATLLVAAAVLGVPH